MSRTVRQVAKIQDKLDHDMRFGQYHHQQHQQHRQQQQQTQLLDCSKNPLTYTNGNQESLPIVLSGYRFRYG